MKNTDYGNCDKCNAPLEAIWFKEIERDSHGIKTGRVRDSVSVLVCPYCLKNFSVDDSFDENWYYTTT